MMKQIEEMTRAQMKMAEDMATKMSDCSREMAEAMMENARRLSEVMSGSVFSGVDKWVDDPGVIRKEKQIEPFHPLTKANQKDQETKCEEIRRPSEITELRHRMNTMRGLLETALDCIESGERVPLDWYDETRDAICRRVDRG